MSDRNHFERSLLAAYDVVAGAEASYAEHKAGLLAVARVALERAAEAVKAGGDVGRMSPGTAANRAFNRGLDAAAGIIAATIPPEKEPT